jgi:hypothetical protein
MIVVTTTWWPSPAKAVASAVAFIYRFGSSLNTHVPLPGFALSPAAHETALVFM